MQRLLVSKKEAAEALGLSVRTVENLIRDHHLKARKVGSRTLIAVRALEQFARRDQPVRRREAEAGTSATA